MLTHYYISSASTVSTLGTTTTLHSHSLSLLHACTHTHTHTDGQTNTCYTSSASKCKWRTTAMEWNEIYGALGHDPAPQGYTGLGTNHCYDTHTPHIEDTNSILTEEVDGLVKGLSVSQVNLALVLSYVLRNWNQEKVIVHLVNIQLFHQQTTEIEWKWQSIC